MNVRAKFKVNSITETLTAKYEGGTYTTCPLKTIALQPVVGDGAENKEFFASTPSGEIKLGVLNDSASKQFQIGKEYYVDFTLAE